LVRAKVEASQATSRVAQAAEEKNVAAAMAAKSAAAAKAANEKLAKAEAARIEAEQRATAERARADAEKARADAEKASAAKGNETHEIVWQCLCEGEWIAYNELATKQLEAAHKLNKISVNLRIASQMHPGGVVYQINLQTQIQTNVDTKFQRRVRRIQVPLSKVCLLTCTSCLLAATGRPPRSNFMRNVWLYH
jgi:hypothetical protein